MRACAGLFPIPTLCGRGRIHFFRGSFVLRGHLTILSQNIGRCSPFVFSLHSWKTFLPSFLRQETQEEEEENKDKGVEEEEDADDGGGLGKKKEKNTTTTTIVMMMMMMMMMMKGGGGESY